MNVTITDSTKKKVKIVFQNPVGCLVNSEGGEFLEQCFHKSYPPEFPECFQECLVKNSHKRILLSPHGSVMKEYRTESNTRGLILIDRSFSVLQKKI